MRMIDEDGMKEKPEDTIYIKKTSRNETQSTSRTWFLTLPLLGRLRNSPWRVLVWGWNPYPGAVPTTRLLVVSSLQSKDSISFYSGKGKDHNWPPSRPTWSPFTTWRAILLNVLRRPICTLTLGLIFWMFYDHLSAHSLLATLGRWGWLMRMRLAWKKSQKILDT